MPAPTASTIPNRTWSEDVYFEIDIKSYFIDPDGDVMTYTAVNLPDGLSINSDTGLITGKPTNAAVGVHDIRITADDGNGGQTEVSFQFTVTNVNDAPTLASPLTDETVAEDAAVNLDVSAAFNDIDAGDVLAYTAAGLPGALTISAAGVISGTPVNSDVGTHFITVTATDSANKKVSDTFILTITNTNDPPTVINPIPDRQATEDQFVSISVSGNFGDVDLGDSRTYSADGLPEGLTINPSSGVISGIPTNGAVGDNSITVTVQDRAGEQIQDTFTLTVVNTNDRPTVDTPIPDTPATEGSAFTLDLKPFFKDIDVGDTLTYSATSLPDGLSIDSATGIISGTPTNAAVGDRPVTVTATDTAGRSVSDIFTIAVANTNDPPTVTSPIPNQTVTEDLFVSISVSGNFSDIDLGDSRTYSATGLPEGLSIDASSGVISGTPTNNAVGENTITVTLQDGEGATAQSTFMLTVANTNDAPTVVTPIPDASATEDSAFSLNVTSFFEDIDAGDSLTYAASGLPDGLSLDSATGIISGTPTNAAVGDRIVTVTASDRANRKVSSSFTITVANTNDAPTLASEIPDQTATEDSFFSVNVSHYFRDQDPDAALTYFANTLPDGLTLNASTGVISGFPTNDAVGVTSITITASDGRGGVIVDTFDIAIANVNDGPTAPLPIPAATATEDQLFTFNASLYFDDVDADDTFTYTASGLPAGLSIAPETGIISGVPVNAAVGTHAIAVTIVDSAGQSASASFDLTVGNTNDAPTLVTDIPAQNATEDVAFSLDVSTNFEDEDIGDALTFFAAGLPEGLTIDSATGIISGTPTNQAVGSNPITITATDGNGGVANGGFELTVANDNDAPVAVSEIPDRQAVEDQSFSFNSSGFFRDIDGDDVLTYSAVGLPDGLAIARETGIISGTPTNAAVGVTSITVTVTDSQGETASSTFDLTVSNTNDAPTTTDDIPAQTAFEDREFTFDASGYFNDVDVSDTLAYSAIGLPEGLSINTATGQISGTPTNGAVGTGQVTVKATDGNGGVVSTSFDLTVENTNDGPAIASPIPDQQATEDQAFVLDINRFFSDIDAGDQLTYTATGLPDGLSLNGETGVISGSPSNAAVGTMAIALTATDSQGATVGHQFTLTVENTNDAPVLGKEIANQKPIQGILFSLDLSAYFSDVDTGDTFTYFETGLPDSFSLDASTGIISGTPANPDAVASTVTITVDDGFGGTVRDTFDILVVSNVAPTVVAPIADQAVTAQTPFGLSLSPQMFNDANEGDRLTYSATTDAGGALPGWLSFNAATLSFSGTPSAAHVGTVGIRVTATDQSGAAVSDDYMLTVNPQVVAADSEAPTNPGPSMPAAPTINPSSPASPEVPATDMVEEDPGIPVENPFELQAEEPITVVSKGSGKGDRLRGGDEQDVMRGLGGNDKLLGGNGDDRLVGGGGNDTLLGGNDEDRLIGGAGSDRLKGGAGDDLLKGGGGEDVLIGQAGVDVLIGGGKQDTFVLSKKGEMDTIRDFKNGQDVLDVKGARFRQLDIQQDGKDTLISVGKTEIALLTGIQASQIDIADFV